MQKVYTYEDYCRLDDDRRYELINGVIYLMDAPGRQHQEVLRELFLQIGNHLRGKPCKVYPAPFNVRLPLEGDDPQKPKNVVQPDLSVVCDPGKLDTAGCLGAPDLVVEILSPSTAVKDLLQKRDLYEQAGVLEYWIFDPIKHQASTLRLENGRFGAAIALEEEQILTTPLLPGLEVNLKEVFQE